MSTRGLDFLRLGSATRRRASQALFAFYVAFGIALPVAHAQAAAGKPSTTHVEAQTTPCSDHNELNCPVWRASTSVAPVGTGAAPVAMPAADTIVVPTQPLVVTRSAVHSPLGARAPPLSR